jgi:hypothetical protein
VGGVRIRVGATDTVTGTRKGDIARSRRGVHS